MAVLSHSLPLQNHPVLHLQLTLASSLRADLVIQASRPQARQVAMNVRNANTNSVSTVIYMYISWEHALVVTYNLPF